MMLSKTATILPESFVPGENHCIIGRGRVVKQHSGNKKFNALIARMAPEYSSAPCKAEKGIILTRLINEIHDQAADAGFVRKDPVTGQWTLVEESLARQTAAQAMRNFLHSDYRSSKQFKSKRRTQLIKEMKSSTSNNKVSGQTTTHSLLSMQGFAAPARCVSPSESSGEFLTGELTTDTLDLLLSAFAPTLNIQSDSNPFEPRPLDPSVDAFSPLPLFSV